MQALGPIDVIELFPEERAELIALLGSLPVDAWAAPTVCAGWAVKDVAAHVVGGDIGVVSRGRDGHRWWTAETPTYAELVAAINAQNEAWVFALRRASPRVILDLLRQTGEWALARFRSLDPMAIGGPVSWAGPEPAPVWLDVAREYTERWAHQQQIRDGRRAAADLTAAVRAGAGLLRAALPHTFRETPAAEGTHVRLVITGEAGGVWSLVRDGGRWGLYTGVETAASATVTLSQDAAWRLFTKGMTAEQARGVARLEGDAALGEQVLRTVSVLA